MDEQYMKLAEDLAKLSPCLRRKYGAVIVRDSEVEATGFNSRVGGSCSTYSCVRDRFSKNSGECVEKGAEIHAEQAVLVNWTPASHASVYLAGIGKDGKLLKGDNCRPCNICSMMLKYAGFRSVIIRQEDDSLKFMSIGKILEFYEASWEEAYP